MTDHSTHHRTDSPAPVATFEQVTIRYGRTLAADAVSFQILPGQVYALLGRNGAGKSSLVRCLVGQQRVQGGRVWLFGADAWAGRQAAMAQVGVMPETPDFPPAMTAEAINALCARLTPGWDAAAVADRLEALGIPRRTPSGRLSRGQRAQLSLVLATAHHPDLLVLDDPTLGIDPLARRRLWDDLIAELADRGTTILITTHDLAVIDGLADRIGILEQGRLVLDEDREALNTRFRSIFYRLDGSVAGGDHTALLDALGAEPAASSSLGWEAVATSFDPEIFARFAGSPGVTEAAERAMTLEEIFVAVAGTGPGGARCAQP